MKEDNTFFWDAVLSLVFCLLYIFSGHLLQPQTNKFKDFISVSSIIPIAILIWIYSYITYPTNENWFFGQEFIWIGYLVFVNIGLTRVFIVTDLLKHYQFILILLSFLPSILFFIGIQFNSKHKFYKSKGGKG
jgi:hypothetical protein